MFRTFPDIFHALRREESRIARDAPDTLGPFKSKLYFNNWKAAFRFLIYTLFFRTEIRAVKESGARWIISRPGGPVGTVAESYLSGFRDIVGARRVFSELTTRDRPTLLRLFRRLTSMAEFLTDRNDLAIRERILFGAARARFMDDERALQDALRKLDAVGVVTFCDQIGVENHIAQVARRIGMKTVTLQHGQYRLLEKERMSPDIEAMYNFVSDIMLCWGEATIREFEKVGVARSRFVPVGMLRQKTETETSQISVRSHRSCQNAFGLALSGDNNRANNEELIVFAKRLQVETGMSCVLRMHPRSVDASYPALAELDYIRLEGQTDFFGAIDIAVMSSTGFFLECYRARCPFVFFDTQFLPEPFRLSGVVVSSPNEVRTILKNYDWDKMEVDIPYYFDDAVGCNKRIDEVLDGPV